MEGQKLERDEGSYQGGFRQKLGHGDSRNADDLQIRGRRALRLAFVDVRCR
jgi:hypothetical protein